MQFDLPYNPLPARTIVWRYAFKDFVVGPCNELAHAAAHTLVRSGGNVDTLFISSSSGLGKTHLTQAVGHAVCQDGNRRHIHLEYLTAEEFSSCFVHALKSREIERFKVRFRDLDMLLLEDVDFLQNKEKLQDEVLSTIKTLQSRGSRVVLTSSFAPRDLRNLDPQLVSRFCSGFLADIDKPDAPTRGRILAEKATARGVVLSEAVRDLLAEAETSDIRQLESCLDNLILKAGLLGQDISVPLARDVLAQCVPGAAAATGAGIEEIIRRVCADFGLNTAQLHSRSRRQNYVVARNVIFFLARKYTDMSLQEIGDHFNRRHSTVLKGIAGLEREMRRETPLGRQIAAVLQRMHDA
jgi:chromosomal replication initiator protein